MADNKVETSINELERILDQEEEVHIEILPNGEVRTLGTTRVQEINGRKPVTMIERYGGEGIGISARPLRSAKEMVAIEADEDLRMQELRSERREQGVTEILRHCLQCRKDYDLLVFEAWCPHPPAGTPRRVPPRTG